MKGTKVNDIDEFRRGVLVEILKLISDQEIEVEGRKLCVATALSNGYDARLYPWMAGRRGNPMAPTNNETEFDIISPIGEMFPTSFRFWIELTDT
jgi:hypothetical protein